MNRTRLQVRVLQVTRSVDTRKFESRHSLPQSPKSLRILLRGTSIIHRSYQSLDQSLLYTSQCYANGSR